jgi:hypothetical protein
MVALLQLCFRIYVNRVKESEVGGGTVLVDACKVKLCFLTLLFHRDHLHTYHTLTYLQ